MNTIVRLLETAARADRAGAKASLRRKFAVPRPMTRREAAHVGA